MSTPKLTKAQAILLRNLSNGPLRVMRTYRPGQKLVELGFAEWAHPNVFGFPRLVITVAGREAAKEPAP